MKYANKLILTFILSGFLSMVMATPQDLKKAVFAGGCFWCMASDFEKLPGVKKVVSGYDGGKTPNPTYELVSSGTTEYVESVEVFYDPTEVSYKHLLDYYWRHIDPTVENAQFCDHGRQYRSVIFYVNDEQARLAKASKKQVEARFAKVYTEISPSTHFYPAEVYHQDYAQKNPIRYKYYRWRCGRDQRIKALWHDE